MEPQRAEELEGKVQLLVKPFKSAEKIRGHTIREERSNGFYANPTTDSPITAI